MSELALLDPYAAHFGGQSQEQVAKRRHFEVEYGRKVRESTIEQEVAGELIGRIRGQMLEAAEREARRLRLIARAEVATRLQRDIQRVAAAGQRQQSVAVHLAEAIAGQDRRLVLE